MNNKLVLQQFLHAEKPLQNLVLNQANYNDKLNIRFSHCGKPGKKRVLTLRDAENRDLKKWIFPDPSVSNSSMSCNVKDIIDMQKSKNPVTFRLYYSSAELPKGRLLVSLSKGSSGIALR